MERVPMKTKRNNTTNKTNKHLQISGRNVQAGGDWHTRDDKCIVEPRYYFDTMSWTIDVTSRLVDSHGRQWKSIISCWRHDRHTLRPDIISYLDGTKHKRKPTSRPQMLNVRSMSYVCQTYVRFVITLGKTSTAVAVFHIQRERLVSQEKRKPLRKSSYEATTYEAKRNETKRNELSD